VTERFRPLVAERRRAAQEPMRAFPSLSPGGSAASLPSWTSPVNPNVLAGRVGRRLIAMRHLAMFSNGTDDVSLISRVEPLQPSVRFYQVSHRCRFDRALFSELIIDPHWHVIVVETLLPLIPNVLRPPEFYYECNWRQCYSYTNHDNSMCPDECTIIVKGPKFRIRPSQANDRGEFFLIWSSLQAAT